MPRGHVHPIADRGKASQGQIFMPFVHFLTHQGHVGGPFDREEVVLDHVKVIREHFQMPRGRMHTTEEAVKVTKGHIHRPKAAMNPISEHAYVAFGRKEVVLDRMKVPQDHFHTCLGKIHAIDGTVNA
jgi:hypothetical protein